MTQAYSPSSTLRIAPWSVPAPFRKLTRTLAWAYRLINSPVGRVSADLQDANQDAVVWREFDFGTPGYVRLAYCVSPDVIERALPTFRALAAEYGLTPKK